MAKPRKYKYDEFKRERVIQSIKITLPEPPPIREVANYGLDEKDQKFTRSEEPRNATTEEMSAFEDQEWDRRINGYWFFNNGNLEYLTGVHYFYINWWSIDVGYPDFIDADRDYFYFWDYCVKDEYCYGMVNVENRRGGKTYRAGCALYEKISRTPESIGGIQSKTGPDAKKFFKKAIVKPWQRLPSYFRPVDVGESRPSSVLSFYEPSKKDTKSQKKKYTKVLRSEINWESAKEESYDGEKLAMYISDEAGKTVDSNVYLRHLIVKECLVDGSEIVGKTIVTTTVEEMEAKGGKNLYEIWVRSNPNKRLETGETESGLYQYFKPAFYGFRGKDKVTGKPFIDEFGYSDQVAARSYFEKRRAGLVGAALSSEKRKYPFEPSDAFRLENKESPFDTNLIHEQLEYNRTLPASHVVQGDFIWAEVDRKVVWKPSTQGKWKVAWMPKEGKTVEKENNVKTEYGKIVPKNHTLVAGVDPYDHSVITGKGSDAGSYVYRKFDPMSPYDTSIFVCQYLARPRDPDVFYEDMIKQSFFYGNEILAENNKIGIVNYFKRRGYDKFLMDRPEPTHTGFSKKRQKEKGIPMTGREARNALIDEIVSYILNNVGRKEEEEGYGKCYFNELLEDWAQFESENWTPYDATVASGLALLAAKKYIVEKKEVDDEQQWFKTYKHSGGTPKRVS